MALLLPEDVIVANKFDADAEFKTVHHSEIPDGWIGLDIGPDSLHTFSSELADCNTIVWNGPMGGESMQSHY